MQMHDSHCIMPGHMNGAVDCEPGCIHRKTIVEHNITIQIDFD